MPVSNFCNGSLISFSDTASFLPGENVTITCSVPSGTVTWTSPAFPNESVILNPSLRTRDTRLDGTIVFDLLGVVLEPKCATATATISNIQEEPMQGLSLVCVQGVQTSKVTINVIGKPRTL